MIDRYPIKYINYYLTITLVSALIFSIAMGISDTTTTFFVTARLLGAITLGLFVILHGFIEYGMVKLLLLCFIAFVVSYAIESFSIKTGQPFGHYYYTDKLGEKFGQVPFKIMLAYFFNGYLALQMAIIFLKKNLKEKRKYTVILIPFIASLLMVIWDFCFEPIMSVVQENWIWEKTGAYFGIPLMNFLGWFITTYLIFQIFYLLIQKKGRDYNSSQTITYWLVIPIMYFIQGLPYLIYPFSQNNSLQLYTSQAIITLATMGVISILCIMKIIKIYCKNYEY
ncbi:MAG: carotenoid biosynthesis protein [Clostridiales bacterium]|nr:carotenoid biosynthesis protein [Clostridiales bacterium]